MKLTPTQARNMIRKELDKGHGIYIDSRFFDVRVKSGVLQVSDFNSWFDVAPGSVFRNGHGRDLFTYEPDDNYKRLTVLWSAGLNVEEWEQVFTPQAVVEVVRETATQYIIAPLGFEQRVSKSSQRLTGFKPGYGVQFEQQVIEPVKPMKSNELAKLAALGFVFPAELGKSRHPMIDDNGQPRDARSIGFEECTTGAGCMALFIPCGKFQILMTDASGSDFPDVEDWETALIGVDDTSGVENEEIVCLSGLEWLDMVNDKQSPPAPMKPFIYGVWHVWQGTAKIMLSHENTKVLREFDTADDCINWLYTNMYSVASRALNAHIKGEK